MIDCEGSLACLHLFRDCFVDSDVLMRFYNHDELDWYNCSFWTKSQIDTFDRKHVQDGKFILNHLKNFRCQNLRLQSLAKFDEALATQVIEAAQSKTPATFLYTDFQAHTVRRRAVYGDDRVHLPVIHLRSLYIRMIRGQEELYHSMKAGDVKLINRYVNRRRGGSRRSQRLLDVKRKGTTQDG